jgi:histidinol-phosphate aminotransferase
MTAARVPVRADLADVEPYGAPQLAVDVRLNTNEPPYPPPPSYYRLLAERSGALDLHRYPDRGVRALRTALGARFGMGPERVWVANGSNEVLLHLFQAYGGPDRRLLLFRPGYSAHPLIARASATPVVEADLDADFRLSPDHARSLVSAHDPDIVCVARPNAPTGVATSLDSLRALHDACDGLLVVDEAYVEFAEDDAVALLDELPRMVITRTFSKAWRLAGLRLGYSLGPGWVAGDVERIRLPYHLDALTQAAGLAALDVADEMTGHIPQIVAERARVTAALSALPGVDVLPSQGNFVLLRTQVAALFDRLLERGVLVRDFSDSPGLPGVALRVTIGTPHENDRFLAALKESLS